MLLLVSRLLCIWDVWKLNPEIRLGSPAVTQRDPR